MKSKICWKKFWQWALDLDVTLTFLKICEKHESVLSAISLISSLPHPTVSAGIDIICMSGLLPISILLLFIVSKEGDFSNCRK